MGFASTFARLSFSGRGRSTHPIEAPALLWPGESSARSERRMFGSAFSLASALGISPASFVFSSITGHGVGIGSVNMKPFRAWVCAVGAAVLITPLVALLLADVAAAQPSPSEKLNAYVGCINRLSERSHESRKRYFSWVSKNGPTGKERIIYGTYTIYDTADCRKAVEKANGIEPRDAALEAAASAYVEAVGALEPLLKETADYYSQEDYKDDRMAKGRALHPRLVAAWDAFENADKALRGGIEAINDRGAAERLAEIESKEGRKARYHVQALMIQAKRVLRTQDTEKPDIAAITQALNEYEGTVKALEQLPADDAKVGSFILGSAKSFLTSAKQLMRRIRDKVPYSQGDRMMLGSGGGWMVEGSPPRLLRDYNQLIEAYNRGAHI
jgi:hypothetical protein